MHAISLNVDNQGKITLPIWLQQQLDIGAGSQVKVMIEKETPLQEKPTQKKRQAGALAHLFKDNEDIGRVFLEPMSEEELAWWNGDYTDDYGISLSKENGNV